LAYQALDAGIQATTVLNAANEVAVARFLAGKLRFLAIPDVVAACLDRLAGRQATDLDGRLALDSETRSLAKTVCERLAAIAV
jgi:1-deoxy-D-xylulose-5-phosphate reductoisomerase